MPTITANTSAQVTLPAGQYINGTGAGVALVGNGAAGADPLNAGDAWQIGPFLTQQTVHLTAYTLLDYDIRSPLAAPPVGLTTAQTTATQALVSMAGNVVVADLAFSGTANNATTYLQNLIDAASAAYSVEKGRVRILVPTAIWMVDGLALKPNIILDLTDATLRKRVNGAGDGFGTTCDIRQALLRTREALVGGTTYYGNSDNIEIVGGTLDGSTFFMSAGILHVINVRNFKITGTKIIRQGTQAFWSTMFGGQNIEINNISTSGGTVVGQDGLHIIHGSDIRVNGGSFESGDDAIAVGMDELGALFDDEGIRNVAITNPRVNAWRGAAVKVYYKAPASGTNRHRVDGVRVTNVHGKSGILRNGGVSLFDHSATSSLDPTRMRNIDITCSLQLGDAAHDGVNALGVYVIGAQDWSVSGSMTITDTTGGATRYQGGSISCSIRGKVFVDIPSLPVNGGHLIWNNSSTQWTADNVVGGTLVGNASQAAAHVILANAPGTSIVGNFQGINATIPAVRFNSGVTATLSTIFVNGAKFFELSGATGSTAINSTAAGRLSHASIVGCDFSGVDNPLDASFVANTTTRNIKGNRSLADA